MIHDNYAKLNRHDNYNKLDWEEKAFVDGCIQRCLDLSGSQNIPLAGDDRCEKVVEAIATWLVESKK